MSNEEIKKEKRDTPKGNERPRRKQRGISGSYIYFAASGG